MTKNKKYPVKSIDKLAERLFGLAHVVCVTTKQRSSIALHYPNKEIETFEDVAESQLINSCCDLCLDYSIQEYMQNYTFDELMNMKLHKEQMAAEQFARLYKEEAKQLEEIYENNKELFTEVFDTYNNMMHEKQNLEK